MLTITLSFADASDSDEGWGPEDLHNLAFWGNEVAVPVSFCKSRIKASLVSNLEGQAGVLLVMNSRRPYREIRKFVTMHEAKLQIEQNKMYLTFSQLKKLVGVYRNQTFYGTHWQLVPTAHIRIIKRIIQSHGYRRCGVAPQMIVKMAI